VLLRNGDGTFQPSATYATDGQTVSIAAGDFNGDGKPDLVASDLSFQTYTVSVLLNNGDGTFQAPVDYAIGEAPAAVAFGDFNGDDNLDIAATSAYCVSILEAPWRWVILAFISRALQW